MLALFGRKVGMTQYFSDGTPRPVTVIYVPEAFVIASRTLADGQPETIIGAKLSKKVNVPQRKELKQLGLKEDLSHRLALSGQSREAKATLSVAELAPGDRVTVIGVTKGKGFAGTIKRHGFHRGPASHGSDNVRRPGSIGAQRPQRVPKGKRMAGRMGSERRTLHNIEVMEVLPNEQLVLLAGSIPGPNKGIIQIHFENHDQASSKLTA